MVTSNITAVFGWLQAGRLPAQMATSASASDELGAGDASAAARHAAELGAWQLPAAATGE